MSQEILSKLNTAHIDEISSSRNEPEWLKDYRKNSLSVYDDLPIETSPLYNKYTDAKKMDPEKVSLSTTTTETIPSFLHKRLGELENEICIIQIGTNIHRINLPDELKSKGLVISSISDAIKNNKKEVVLWGDGTPTRDLLFVDDLSDSLISTLLSNSTMSPINIGSGNEISIKELSLLIRDLMGGSFDIIWG